LGIFIEMKNEPVSRFKIVGLGELIWDLLPNGKQLGGAPSNFAYISAVLGDDAFIASRIGRDELGREALSQIKAQGVSPSYIQIDPVHPTGTVGVSIGEHGEPSFQVNENSAWDYLEFSEEWNQLAGEADAVCFGTLGQRERVARQTIKLFLEATRNDCLRIFDVNLRRSFFTRTVLEEALRLATIVKLNHEEILQVARLLESSLEGDIEIARMLLGEFGVEIIALTRGALGSVLITEQEAVAHPGFRVQVVDTIGAGDAFTATLTHHYLRRLPLEEIAEATNRMGAWVAGQAGATPRLPLGGLNEILRTLKNPD
jgi:fructokinase